MTLFWSLITILKVFSISLGVGSSTLAITNFFVAIADGTIDETERRMMGVVYVVLRVAMVLILLTTVMLLCLEYGSTGLASMSAFSLSQIIVLFVLYLNALLMTAHLVPTTVGPAFQAGSWYTLGTLTALQVLGATGFSLMQFLLAYAAWLILAIGIVNGIMAALRYKRKSSS